MRPTRSVQLDLRAVLGAARLSMLLPAASDL